MVRNSSPKTENAFTEYLIEKIQAQRTRGKSEEEIAKEAGFQSPRYIGMLLSGQANLPLDKVLPMSRALDVDPRSMFRLAFGQYSAIDDAALDELLGKANH